MVDEKYICLAVVRYPDDVCTLGTFKFKTLMFYLYGQIFKQENEKVIFKGYFWFFFFSFFKLLFSCLVYFWRYLLVFQVFFFFTSLNTPKNNFFWFLLCFPLLLLCIVLISKSNIWIFLTEQLMWCNCFFAVCYCRNRSCSLSHCCCYRCCFGCCLEVLKFLCFWFW